ncbi:MAG: hypothetical protein ACI4E0_13270 [Blautia sp.]
MKIKVVFFCENKKYISRLLEYYENNFERFDRFDLHLFSEQELVLPYLEDNSPDVILAEEGKLDFSNYEKSICIYLVNDNSIDKINEVKAIGKYQKPENIFASIFSVYADNSGNNGKIYSLSNDSALVYAFQNVSGGSGNSTAAMAFAIAHARLGKKVLYLNLELTGSIDDVFTSDLEDDFGNILFTVKKSIGSAVKKKSDSDGAKNGGNSGNLGMKLLTSIAQDFSGVFFIKTCKAIPNMLEMKTKELEQLLHVLKYNCGFDIIVIDKEAGLSEQDSVIREYASRLIFVLEATIISQKKYLKYVSGLALMNKEYQSDISPKMKLIFNKYENTQKIFDSIQEEIVGGVPFIKQPGYREIVYTVSQMKVLETI